MADVLYALFPVVCLILLGAWIRRRQWVPDGFWPSVEWLTYYLFFPALLVHSIATSDLSGLRVGEVLAALVMGILLVGSISVLLRLRVTMTGPALTSLIQGSVRFNTYVILAIAASLYDQVGITLTALLVAIAVPLVNLISVGGLSWFAGSDDGFSVRRFAGQLVRNPLVVACLIGAILNLTGLGLPTPIDRAFAVAGRAALPLGLLAVGAGLVLDRMVSGGPVLIAMCALKLILLPLVVWGFCDLFGVEGATRVIAVLIAGAPTATSAYVLARQMGGDASLMAAGITATTLASALTLPIFLTLLR
ncbi:MAG: AEC family transporter [Magnetovibrionaceae bacterium]